MIERAEAVANVMQQRADHVFVVAPVTQRQRSSLQGMAVAIDCKAAKVTIQQLQMVHYPVS